MSADYFHVVPGGVVADVQTLKSQQANVNHAGTQFMATRASLGEWQGNGNDAAGQIVGQFQRVHEEFDNILMGLQNHLTNVATTWPETDAAAAAGFSGL